MKTFEFGSKLGMHPSDFSINAEYQTNTNELYLQPRTADTIVHIILSGETVYNDRNKYHGPVPIDEISHLIAKALDHQPKAIHVFYNPPRIVHDEVKRLVNSKLSNALKFSNNLESVHLHWAYPQGYPDDHTAGIIQPRNQIVHHVR